MAVGDSVITADMPEKEPLSSYKKVQPVVFSGIYSLDGSKFMEEYLLKTIHK